MYVNKDKNDYRMRIQTFLDDSDLSGEDDPNPSQQGKLNPTENITTSDTRPNQSASVAALRIALGSASKHSTASATTNGRTAH